MGIDLQSVWYGMWREILSDTAGRLSTVRVNAILVTVVVLGAWVFSCMNSGYKPIGESNAAVLALAWGTKMLQKGKE